MVNMEVAASKTDRILVSYATAKAEKKRNNIYKD